MPRKSRRTRTTRRTQHSNSGSDPGACCTAGPMGAAGRKSRTPGRSPESGWRPSMTRPPHMRWSSLIEPTRRGDRFFVCYNTTAMHFRTHCAEKHNGKSGGQGDYNDVMVAHDENIGLMLAKLEELGIAEDTIVMYLT